MLSKFFIDRPIFATVLSVIITLTGGISLRFLPVAQYPRITPPSVYVSISYPGASAQVVADTVAAPIEQEVTGVPGMLYMSSQMGNDGSYSLSVTFDVDVDLNTALVMVQNRVTLAMPKLPTPVQDQGITIRKKTPDTLCMINFISAVDVTTNDGKVIRGVRKAEDKDTITLRGGDGKKRVIARKDIRSTSKPIYSDIYLSNFMLINVRDEILRVDGVSDATIMGERDYSIRAWLDPQKLAARNMTATDVAAAIRDQNLQSAAGQIGSPPTSAGQTMQLPLDTLGQLVDPLQFGNIIIKTGQSQPMRSASSPTSPAPSSAPDGSMNVAPTVMQIGSNTVGGTVVGGANVSGGADTGGGASSDGTVNMISTNMRGPKKTTAKVTVSKSGGNTAPLPPSVGIVRLKDVARVEMGALNYNITCTFDGAPAVGLNIYQLPGTNALDVGDNIRAKMKELKKRFPDGLDYTIAYDTTPFIRESISEVFHTLLDAVILVAIVVLLFLQDWRAMILPMIDVPVSLIGTFAVMALMGYSLNNISLFGLVLAIGIVVDDAIVVLENIERQMAKGHDVRTATIKAMEEISGPIMAITLVLCAVFVPCAFISGITGRFFRQFAVTIAASTVISAVNALTMTPSRALVIFKAKQGQEHHKREALPWWIFGLLGLLTLSWLPMLVGEPLGMPSLTPPEDPEDAEPIPSWLYWSLTALYFSPGMLIGLALGWFIIEPVNAVLGVFFRGFNRFFDFMTGIYGWTIGKALRISVVVLLGYGGLMALTYTVFRDAPRGFVPQQDQGRLIVSVQLPDSAGLERTQVSLTKVEKIIRETPGVAHSIGLGGISFVEQANGSNFGSFFVILKPFAERQTTELKVDGIMARLRKRFKTEVNEARVVAANTSPIPGISTSGGFKLMIQDRGGLGLATLQDQTDKFIRKINQKIGEQASAKKKQAAADGAKAAGLRPMLANVNTQFRSNTPQLFLKIDDEKVASLQVSPDDVNQAMTIYMGSLYVNSFNEFGRTWQVTLQADAEFRSRVEHINLLQVRNASGQMVPLGTLVSVNESTGPLFVRRYNLYAAGPIGGALLPGVSSGEVISEINQLSEETLPRSMSASWTELMFLQIKEGSTTGIVFALAVVCVFLALAALYESWTLPLAVILVVPLCVLCSLRGVLLRHDLFGQDSSVDIFVQIGLVVLVGLACKNAILVVEFAKELHLQGGRSVYDATLEASRLRLRPILMTSFAFILGVVPLCVAAGAGAEMRKSLGVAVFSGMVGVTAFGIFLTPIFFYVIQGIGENRLFSGRAVQWALSCLFGALIGMGFAYLLLRLGLFRRFPPFWVVTLGGVAGVLAVAAVRGLHKTLISKGP